MWPCFTKRLTPRGSSSSGPACSRDSHHAFSSAATSASSPEGRDGKATPLRKPDPWPSWWFDMSWPRWCFLMWHNYFTHARRVPKRGYPRGKRARGPESFEGKKMETASRGRATEPTATNGRAFVSKDSRPLFLLLPRATRPR